jgi:hypothetical protein
MSRILPIVLSLAVACRDISIRSPQPGHFPVFPASVSSAWHVFPHRGHLKRIMFCLPGSIRSDGCPGPQRSRTWDASGSRWRKKYCGKMYVGTQDVEKNKTAYGTALARYED